jgi:hypothetical protein
MQKKEEKIGKWKKSNFKKKRKKGKVGKKMQKKKGECTVDYCCNPQYIVWENSDSPTPFRVLFEKY